MMRLEVDSTPAPRPSHRAAQLTMAATLDLIRDLCEQSQRPARRNYQGLVSARQITALLDGGLEELRREEGHGGSGPRF